MTTTSPSDAGAPLSQEMPTAQGHAGGGAHRAEEHIPLRRSTRDKVVAGVAGGLGRYLGVDPVIIRIALVVFAVTGGAGVLLYLIAWIAIPEERSGEIPVEAVRPDRSSGAILLGGVLMIAGGMLFADRLVPSFSTFVGPMVLVALGAALILGARR